MPTAKLDLYQSHKAEYATPKQPQLLTIRPAQYLSIAGQGSPGEAAFGEAIGALYAVAFTTKMRFKWAGRDYAVSKLEGLWSGPPGREDDFLAAPPGEWHWELLIRTPDFITAADLRRTQAELSEKGKPAQVQTVRVLKLREGSCVQMLHIGPYTTEPTTIAAMRVFAHTRGLVPRGRHHEIYLSDPRRVAPARLKTILRQPVARLSRGVHAIR
jgi:hypothetical protein